MNSKEKLLEILENNKGKYISGEVMGNTLNISRGAIWKCIRELKSEGYDIISTRNKGYCLTENNDVISAQGIKSYLKDKTLADKIITYKTIESTNDTAKKMALDNSPHGTIVISEEQTKGRGRYGKNFYSPKGLGIYMSTILKTDISISDSVLVTTSAAVATCRAIKKLTKFSPKIKWVNDIFLFEKKICGILTEAIMDFESGTVDSMILGIGINFRENFTGFPKNLENIAGSLFSKEKDKTITRNMLIAEIISNMMEICDDIKNPNIIKEYKELSFILGKEIKFLKNKEEYHATAIDIDNSGFLVIKNQDGTIEKLNSGEVSIRQR